MTTDLGSFYNRTIQQLDAVGESIESGIRPETVAILIRVGVTVTGGTTDNWQASGMTLQGRLLPSRLQPQTIVIAGASTVRQLWEWVFALGTNIPQTVRLQANGVTYAVIADDAPQSYTDSTRVLCYEV